MASPQVGQAPTPQQQQYADAAKDLSPDKSLARVDDLAKFVFANVAVIGTILAGLGLFSSAGQTLNRGPGVFGIPLALALVAASLAAGIGALFPSLSPMNPGDLGSVESFFRREIPRRGLFAMAALAFFAGAVVTAGVVAVTDSGVEHTGPAIYVQTTGAGSAAKLEIRASVAGLPTGSEVTVSGIGHFRRSTKSLCTSVWLIGASGAADTSCDTAAGRFTSYTVTAVVKRGNQTIQSNTVSLER